MKRSGKLSDALACYKTALDLDPLNSVYLYNTGVLYSATENPGQAIDVLERAIELNNENVYAYIALGDAYEKKKD